MRRTALPGGAIGGTGEERQYDGYLKGVEPFGAGPSSVAVMFAADMGAHLRDHHRNNIQTRR